MEEMSLKKDLNKSFDSIEVESANKVMEQNLKIQKETRKAWIRAALVIAFMALIFYAGIVIGAHSSCVKSGGVLLKGMICSIP